MSNGTPRLQTGKQWIPGSGTGGYWIYRNELEVHDHKLVVSREPCCLVCKFWCVRWTIGEYPNQQHFVDCVVSHEPPTSQGSHTVTVLGGPYDTPEECAENCYYQWWCVQRSVYEKFCAEALAGGEPPPYAVSGPYISQSACESQCQWFWCVRTYHLNSSLVTESCVASNTRPVVGANQLVVGGPWNSQAECVEWGCFTACGFNAQSCDELQNENPFCCECWTDDCSGTGVEGDCDGWWFADWDLTHYRNGVWDPVGSFAWPDISLGRDYLTAFVGLCLKSQPSGGPFPGRLCIEHHMYAGFTVANSAEFPPGTPGNNESNAGRMRLTLIPGPNNVLCEDGGDCWVDFYAGRDPNRLDNEGPHIWAVGPLAFPAATGTLPIWIGAGDRFEFELRVGAPVSLPGPAGWRVTYSIRAIRIYRNNAVAWELNWNPGGNAPFPMIQWDRYVLESPPTFCYAQLRCIGEYRSHWNSPSNTTACDDIYIVKGICAAPTMDPPPPPPDPD